MVNGVRILVQVAGVFSTMIVTSNATSPIPSRIVFDVAAAQARSGWCGGVIRDVLPGGAVTRPDNRERFRDLRCHPVTWSMRLCSEPNRPSR
jgi:hypothetical protein